MNGDLHDRTIMYTHSIMPQPHHTPNLLRGLKHGRAAFHLRYLGPSAEVDGSEGDFRLGAQDDDAETFCNSFDHNKRCEMNSNKGRCEWRKKAGPDPQSLLTQASLLNAKRGQLVRETSHTSLVVPA